MGKVRHLSTGTLWLQEKELKDILKILKIPGSENIADIFTKYLGHALMEKHLTFMGLEYQGGRAKAAAQLHSVNKLTRELRQLKAEIKNHKSEMKQVQIKEDDAWIPNLPGRTVVRMHQSERRQMFTPLNVKNGPRTMCEVGSVRTTIGKYIHGGRFVKVDQWKNSKLSNQQLRSNWNGITVFSDKPLADEMIAYIRASHS